MSMTFAEIGVHPELVAALSKQSITEPTAIQIAAMPALLAGRNAYLNSETGTGKTLAYLLPIVSRLDVQRDATQVVVLAPTHELAIQIQHQCADLMLRAGWPVRTLLLIGGTSTARQIDKLKTKPHVVVGSPGRIRELIGTRKLKTPAIACIVMDEADRLLLDESLPDVRAIIRAAPAGRQLVFVSATEQPGSAEAIATLALDVIMLRTGAGPVNENIEHRYLVCEERDKPDILRKLLHAMPLGRAMVFVHRNATAEMVAAKLAHHKVPVANLHAAAEKRDRKQAMEDFRSGRALVLITSDVAARGLDIAGVANIVNFDVPTQSKAYLHRVGRTARAGARGWATTLMTADEVRLVPRFESELGIVLHHVRLREGRVIAFEEPR
jgi:superfamily II DNA/RNA helicase